MKLYAHIVRRNEPIQHVMHQPTVQAGEAKLKTMYPDGKFVTIAVTSDPNFRPSKRIVAAARLS